MYKKELVVNNKTGLHARPATDLMMLCSKFSSDIEIITEKSVINPKSIISILGGGVSQGTRIILQIEGEDEEIAGEQISSFIEAMKE